MSKNSVRALYSQLVEWLPTTKQGKIALEKAENSANKKNNFKNRGTYGKNRS